MNESEYQKQLIKKIKALIPNCKVLKNDPTAVQGIPDLTIFYRNAWAMLEVKISADAKVQPNQEHYISHFNKMSFAAFIHPGNEEEVLRDLQSAFGIRGKARFS
jgi:hypothetical protein